MFPLRHELLWKTLYVQSTNQLRTKHEPTSCPTCTNFVRSTNRLCTKHKSTSYEAQTNFVRSTNQLLTKHDLTSYKAQINIIQSANQLCTKYNQLHTKHEPIFYEVQGSFMHEVGMNKVSPMDDCGCYQVWKAAYFRGQL